MIIKCVMNNEIYYLKCKWYIPFQCLSRILSPFLPFDYRYALVSCPLPFLPSALSAQCPGNTFGPSLQSTTTSWHDYFFHWCKHNYTMPGLNELLNVHNLQLYTKFMWTTLLIIIANVWIYIHAHVSFKVQHNFIDYVFSHALMLAQVQMLGFVIQCLYFYKNLITEKVNVTISLTLPNTCLKLRTEICTVLIWPQ